MRTEARREGGSQWVQQGRYTSGPGGDGHSYGWVNNAGTSGGRIHRRLGAFAKLVEVRALAAWAAVAGKLPFRSYDEGQNSRAGSDRGK